MGAADLYTDLLSVLKVDRRAHSLAVGRKVESVAGQVGPWLRADLVAAATLHDIGYGHPITGFHPLDGAKFLAREGFSRVVCHLVAHHSASTYEAEERGMGPEEFADFRAPVEGLGPAHAVLWWADLTTGPTGEDMSVEERLKDIAARYPPTDVVARNAVKNRAVLLAAGQTPTGSIQVPC